MLDLALYIIPTPLGNTDDFTLRAIKILQQINFIAAEDTRHSKPLITPINSNLQWISAHEHNENQAAEEIIKILQSHQSVALISDAGTPAISDPGAKIVAKVRQAGFRIIPLPGACAAVTALSAAGLANHLNSHFLFYGFLPTKNQQRLEILNSLKTASTLNLELNQAIIFYESPHRIAETLQNLVEIFGRQNRSLTIARELSKIFEQIVTLKINEVLQWFESDKNHQKGEFVLILSADETEKFSEKNSEKNSQNLVENNFENDLNKAFAFKFLAEFQKHQPKELNLPPSKLCSLIAKITNVSKKDLYDYLINL